MPGDTDQDLTGPGGFESTIAVGTPTSWPSRDLLEPVDPVDAVYYQGGVMYLNSEEASRASSPTHHRGEDDAVSSGSTGPGSIGKANVPNVHTRRESTESTVQPQHRKPSIIGHESSESDVIVFEVKGLPLEAKMMLISVGNHIINGEMAKLSASSPRSNGPSPAAAAPAAASNGTILKGAAVVGAADELRYNPVEDNRRASAPPSCVLRGREGGGSTNENKDLNNDDVTLLDQHLRPKRPSRVKKLVEELRKSQKVDEMVANMTSIRSIVVFGVLLLLLAAGAIIGLMVFAIEITKETKVNNGILQASHPTSESKPIPVQTTPAYAELERPQAEDANHEAIGITLDYFESIREVKYTVSGELTFIRAEIKSNVVLACPIEDPTDPRREKYCVSKPGNQSVLFLLEADYHSFALVEVGEKKDISFRLLKDDEMLQAAHTALVQLADRKLLWNAWDVVGVGLTVVGVAAACLNPTLMALTWGQTCQVALGMAAVEFGVEQMAEQTEAANALQAQATTLEGCNSQLASLRASMNDEECWAYSGETACGEGFEYTLEVTESAYSETVRFEDVGDGWYSPDRDDPPVDPRPNVGHRGSRWDMSDEYGAGHNWVWTQHVNRMDDCLAECVSWPLRPFGNMAHRHFPDGVDGSLPCIYATYYNDHHDGMSNCFIMTAEILPDGKTDRGLRWHPSPVDPTEGGLRSNNHGTRTWRLCSRIESDLYVAFQPLQAQIDSQTELIQLQNDQFTEYQTMVSDLGSGRIRNNADAEKQMHTIGKYLSTCDAVMEEVGTEMRSRRTLVGDPCKACESDPLVLYNDFTLTMCLGVCSRTTEANTQGFDDAKTVVETNCNSIGFQLNDPTDTVEEGEGKCMLWGDRCRCTRPGRGEDAWRIYVLNYN